MAGALLRAGSSLLPRNEHLPCEMVVLNFELLVIFIKMCPNCSQRRVGGVLGQLGKVTVLWQH